MDAQYLDAHKFLETLQENNVEYTETLVNLMQYAVIEEVAPVVHSHWIEPEDESFSICARCKKEVVTLVTAKQMDETLQEGVKYWGYCPHCGAIMDEKEGKQ